LHYQPLLFQPVPSLLGYSVTELVEEVRATWFPDLAESVEARFAAVGRLAFMNPQFMGIRQKSPSPFANGEGTGVRP
jgi:hypothetical protein